MASRDLDHRDEAAGRGGDRLLRNALLAFAVLCLAAGALFATVPTARAGLLVAYEAMYKAMVTMAVMCGF